MQEERLISPPDSVSFVELEHVHDGLKGGILAEISELIDASAFINGPQVAAFERAFAAYCGAAYCVGVASGLDALRLGLLAGGIEPGDEVILPALTFVATIEAVRQAGGVPVLADVTEDDYALDVERAEAAISRRTRFLLPVHLHGQMADLGALRRPGSSRRSRSRERRSRRTRSPRWGRRRT
jgi:dTDP-4-amino-4,6-dideoxygalactose transaminase